MSDRAYHHGNLRAELIAQAWRHIEQAGADGLSLRRLARELGVSHGASARHFADKQALLDAVGAEGFRALNGALAAASADDADDGGGVGDRFCAVGHAYVRFATEHPQILAVMYATKHRPEASSELVELSHAGMQALVRMIESAQRRGVVGAGDPQRLATVAFAAVHGVATLATDELLGGMPVDEVADATIDFVWRGLTSGAAAEVR